jgi:Fe-S cluster assembly iron-binding protein IscA
MLTITQKAAEMLAEARQSTGAPDSYGVRLFAAMPPEGGEPSLAIAFVPDAEPGDKVTEHEGLTAYVAPEVSDALDDATLDVSGADDAEALVLTRGEDQAAAGTG